MSSPVVHLGERLCIAEHGCVAINFWRGIPQPSDWKDAMLHLETLHQRHPKGVAAFVVFPLAGASLSFRDVQVDRVEMERVAKRFISIGRGCATVIEGSGFVAATVRSVVSGLTLVTRPPFPSRIFETVDQGVSWFVPTILSHLKTATPAGVSGAVEAARRAITDRAARSA